MDFRILGYVEQSEPAVGSSGSPVRSCVAHAPDRDCELTLNANETKTFPPVEITLPGRSNDVDARILADISHLVQEKNEQNNKASLKFTGQVLH